VLHAFDTGMRNELTELDTYLLAEGTHARLFDKLGCQWLGPGRGVDVALWAPNAEAVAVIGDWNGWNPTAQPLIKRHDGSGIWQAHCPEAQPGEIYKYRVTAQGRHVDKADPLAFHAELPPAQGSRVWPLAYEWSDGDWLAQRAARNAWGAPISVYELHLGSWRRPGGVIPGYREIAPMLAEYVLQMGFTHVEVLPLTEHPFYGSWGYQTTGYFAPTARYGTPQDLMYLIDHLHRHGIGVILDWVPSHFPTDAHGLQHFDGTHLYEHADPRQGFHPEWNSSIFNYGRGEVRSFLISSALFWLEKYHVDGIRVDAVASMLYLDYARQHGEWIPNPQGGKENLEAIHFLQKLNEAVYREHPDVITIAEESTAWPMVSRPTAAGGLGFAMKWNMGWMHESPKFMQQDPVHRRHHLDALTFSLVYAFNENFVLPLSHDEVVHGKASLIGKMPGDAWQQFANLRVLYGWMWAHPGKKLLFMGDEFAQRREWAHEGQLDWPLSEAPAHAGVRRLVSDLNHLYRSEPALHELDFSGEGFEWVDSHDTDRTVLLFLRKARPGGSTLLVACNFTPVPREQHVAGVPLPGYWREVLNTDAQAYGGSGCGNLGGVESQPLSSHGRPHSVSLTLPPLSAIYLRHEPHGRA
jgi:1,4-alpha-glucan branching enzyme